MFICIERTGGGEKWIHEDRIGSFEITKHDGWPRVYIEESGDPLSRRSYTLFDDLAREFVAAMDAERMKNVREIRMSNNISAEDMERLKLTFTAPARGQAVCCENGEMKLVKAEDIADLPIGRVEEILGRDEEGRQIATVRLGGASASQPYNIADLKPDWSFGATVEAAPEMADQKPARKGKWEFLGPPL